MLKKQTSKNNITSKVNPLLHNQCDSKPFVVNYTFIDLENPNKSIDKAYDIIFEMMELNGVNLFN